ncbi:MAG: hypothetical protein QM734_00315 [Cyclobacteriaceae bacterium]
MSTKQKEIILMQKIILVAVFFSLAFTTYAQRGQGRGMMRSPEDRATMFTNWIDKTVTLTPDQKTKVQAVNLKYAQMRQGLKDSTQNNQQTTRQELMTDNKEQDAELKAILTSDQYVAYTAAKKQRVEDMRARRRRE